MSARSRARFLNQAVAAVLAAALTACAPTVTRTGREVQPEFPSPLSGPGQPELATKGTKQIDDGWRSLLSGDFAAAASAATLSGYSAQGRLLSAQVDLLDGQASPTAELAGLADEYPAYAAAWLTLSFAAEAEGDELQAYSAAQHGAELWDRSVWRQRVDDLYATWVSDRVLSATESHEAGDDASALETVDAALVLDPAHREGQIVKARCLAALERYDEADAILVSMAPDTEALAVAAGIAEAQGEWARAMNLYETLSESYPGRNAALRRAQLHWRISILPPYVREALDSAEVTRAQLAVILVSLVPEIEAAEGGRVPLLTDIVDLPSQREIIEVVRTDLLNVDPLERRFHPERPVSAHEARDAIEALSHLVGFSSPVWCLEDEVTPQCTSLGEPVSGETLSEVVLSLQRDALS